ncbi:MAG: amidohydrolase family protein [Novosphingobium sp.]|nr:amidohydrolase family protein [Novosphingobium sp.]
MTKRELPFPVYDADHHFYDPDDSITRHLPDKYKEDFQFIEVNGRRRLAIGGQISRYIPNPTFDRVAAPGSHLPYYKAENPEGLSIREIGGDPIVPTPSMRNRDARMEWMDDHNVEGALVFPNLFSVIESRMDYDHEFLFSVAHSLNRYIDEEWGFARDGRLFMTPVMSLADVDMAVKELDWLLKQGARAIAMSPSPVPGYRGFRSPGDEEFDPFWARIAEAGVFVAYHASDTPYSKIATWWTRGKEWTPFKPDPMTACTMMIERAISDTIAALICHGVFDRHPNVRVASIENGAVWVGPLIDRLTHVYGQMPQYFKEHPVETFKRNFFITPFTEDSVPELISHMGADRVMFGSDWPHPEGLADPLDFVDEAEGVSMADLEKVMSSNLKGLLEGVRD